MVLLNASAAPDGFLLTSALTFQFIPHNQCLVPAEPAVLLWHDSCNTLEYHAVMIAAYWLSNFHNKFQ